MLADFIDGADVGMIERGGCASFAWMPPATAGSNGTRPAGCLRRRTGRRRSGSARGTDRDQQSDDGARRGLGAGGAGQPAAERGNRRVLSDRSRRARRRRRRDGAPWPVASVQGPADIALGINDRSELAAGRHASARAGPRTADARRRQFRRAGNRVRRCRRRNRPRHDEFPFSVIGAGTTIGGGCTIGRTPSSTAAGSATGHDSRLDARSRDRRPWLRRRPLQPSPARRDAGEASTSATSPRSRTAASATTPDRAISVWATGKRRRREHRRRRDPANYDGERQYTTTIGARAFIGSDTILRAPVSVGDTPAPAPARW